MKIKIKNKAMQYEDLKYKVEKRFISQKKYKPTQSFYFDKRLIFTLSAFFIMLAVVIFLLWASVNIRPIINHKIERWVHQSQGHKFEVDTFDYRTLRFTAGGVIFEQVRAHGKVRYEYPHFQPREFDLYIPMAQISFRFGLRHGLRLAIFLNGLEVVGGPLLPGIEEEKRRLEAVSDMTFETAIPLSGWSPWRSGCFMGCGF
jgi:hypothetical protein